MSKKGGKKSANKGRKAAGAVKEKKITIDLLDHRWIYVIFTIVFVVGLLFLGVFYLGVLMERNSLGGNKKPVEVESVSSVKSIIYSHDVADFTYNHNEDVSVFSLAGLGDKDYAVIESKGELNKLLETLLNQRKNENEVIMYNVDETFFNTGSVIAVSRKQNMTLKSVTRDENYNLYFTYDKEIRDMCGDAFMTVDRSASGCIDGDQTYQIDLVRVQNIQPVYVEIRTNEIKVE